MPHFTNQNQMEDVGGVGGGDGSATPVSVSGLMCDEDEAYLAERSNGVGERLSFSGVDEEYVEMLIESEVEDDDDDVGFKGFIGFDADLSDVKSSNWAAAARLDAVTWILNVRAVFGFQFSTVYLAMTYFDHFTSHQSIDNGKYWAVKLLSVACVSVAAKMEEVTVPVLSDYPLGEFMFEKNVIQRMELLVLSALEWKMARITPFMYFSYFSDKFCGNSESRPKDQPVVKATQLTMDTLREMNLVSRRPSSIAAAAILAALDIHLDEKALELKLGLLPSSRSLKNEEICSLYRLMQEMEKRKCKTPGLDIFPSWPWSQRLSPAADDKSASPTPNTGTKRRLSYNDDDKDQKSSSKKTSQ
uniref:Cyclin-like domain-containing protein n=1 Tax=Kalanchoe fedtschenkoi TaxID=63787 RepID=A0A7N0T5H1_KALFE